MADNLTKLHRFSKFYIEFHENIFNTHVKCMQHLVAALPLQKFSNMDVSARLSQRKPILDAKNLIIEEKDLEKIFDFVFPVIKKYFSKRKKPLLKLEDLADKRRFSLKQLVAAMVGKDEKFFMEIAEKHGLSQQLLEIVIELISVPYFELIAEYFNKQLAEIHYREPVCPVCGNSPALAKINEQKKTKLLWCRLCDTTWTFYDKICPYCLNDKIEEQKFIFPADKKPFRIEACNRCNRYMKTINGSFITSSLNYSVINISSYYLDILAKYYGFKLDSYIEFYFNYK